VSWSRESAEFDCRRHLVSPRIYRLGSNSTDFETLNAEALGGSLTGQELALKLFVANRGSPFKQKPEIGWGYPGHHHPNGG
jgi:hypothetical protein